MKEVGRLNQTPEFLQEKNGDLWLIEDERENMKVSYRIKEVVFSEKSPFQHVMILDSYDFGRMLVLDGVVQTTSLDGHIYNEMITHIPLSIHPNPERVLIIGGGDCGAAREVCKYENVKEIDMVEIDELVVDACKKYLPAVSGNLSDPRVNFIFNDGIKHVENIRDHYDVIIVDSSDPVGPARALFEKSFYENIHRALKEDGLMVCQSQSPLFHRSVMNQTIRHIRDLYPAVKVYTATVPTYPGGFWSFTLGSKNYDQVYVDRFEKDTKYVNHSILTTCFDVPAFLKHD
ncbi:polyamine aminopropyltransferase [Thermoactinomyces intermedius]|jgi:spermidine synthase|uniref:Polyamine aminopropyltransferase n=1 Tax=Thermoactinomyces intermedius TaxID=2024 RepID=A0A8I1DEF7_THEIN|nr:polyamine aminopropyltransferase [Thermoactinomyces intermedius]MBA4836811.1 polyamine aminopropyltransferase [Thermoactinomyces intermedius]MBH8583786.1 polyamine aminopropyltransferase [Thermoactinomyces sp. CICC 10735]MBH8594615.1 polyamine aminopropyltransferase [Thermoactinomyces intermedius]MBH8602138.1 polyamine aminopropyltransferase [Thermoactinomyces sp. CICC 23799]